MEIVATATESFPHSFHRKPEQDASALDSQDTSLRNQVHAVKRHHNMKISINAKLAPEILSHVFFYVKELMCHDSEQSFKLGLYLMSSSLNPSWVQCIAHVCSYWRSIALSDPSLWTKDFPNSLVGVKTFLERSEDLPILLDWRITDWMLSDSNIRPLILSHMSRAWQLEMIINDHSLIQNAINALDTDMPHLRTLNVQLLGSLRGFRLSLTFPRPGNLNHVHYLRLKFFGFPWNQVELNNLTHLEISGDFNPAHDASLAQIYDVLRKSPGLRTLVLAHLIRNHVQDRDTTPQELSLPMLKVLFLHQTGRIFTESFIRYAILPKVQDITLQFSMNQEEILTDFLTSAIRKLRHDRPKDVTFAFKDPGNNAYRCGYSYHNGSSFRFRNLAPYVESSQATLLCLEESDLSTLQRLHCIVDEDPSIEWWTRIFGKANSLEILVIEGPLDLSSLLCALTPEEKEIRDDAAEFLQTQLNDDFVTLLPSLRSLIFENVTFTDPGDAYEYDGHTNRGSIKHLEHCLELRADCGFRLADLEIPENRRKLGYMGVELWRHVDRLSCNIDEESPFDNDRFSHNDNPDPDIY